MGLIGDYTDLFSRRRELNPPVNTSRSQQCVIQDINSVRGHYHLIKDVVSRADLLGG